MTVHNFLKFSTERKKTGRERERQKGRERERCEWRRTICHSAFSIKTNIRRCIWLYSWRKKELLKTRNGKNGPFQFALSASFYSRYSVCSAGCVYFSVTSPPLQLEWCYVRMGEHTRPRDRSRLNSLFIYLVRVLVGYSTT